MAKLNTKQQLWHKGRRERRKAIGVCSCGRQPTIGKTRCEDCRISGNLSSVRLRKVLKLLTISKYGGMCECCGEINIGFLTIDHMDEVKHLKSVTGRADQLYKWLKKNDFPRGFRVLCFNCNSGREANGGVCPHIKLKVEWQTYMNKREDWIKLILDVGYDIRLLIDKGMV